MEKQIPQTITNCFTENNSVKLLNYNKTEQSADEVLILSDKNQYLEDLQLEIWNFHTLSYQICKNWLKNREGGLLNNEDTQHYQHIIMGLQEIAKLIEEIKMVILLEKLKKRKVFEKVRAIVADKLEIEPGKLSPVANLANDLGADSLDRVELVMVLEEAFEIKIVNQVLESLLTIQQIINYISQKVDFTIDFLFSTNVTLN